MSIPSHIDYITYIGCDLLHLIMQFVDINFLLNTSKKFSDIKKKLYYWNLTPYHSLCYYHDSIFREKIQSNIILPYQQLSLNLSNSNIENTDNLDNIRILNLSNCGKLTCVGDLTNIFSLCLSECIALVDITSLKNIFKIDLSFCESIEDVSILGYLENLDSLNLFCCDKITDISMLNNIPNFKPPDYILNIPKNSIDLDNINDDDDDDDFASYYMCCSDIEY
jgi:hypothetical protein